MHKLIRAVFICSFVFCNTIISISQTYTSGVVRVKFKENVATRIQPARLSKNQFGIASLDQTGLTLGVVSIQRVFRESMKFEKAHRKFGLHLWYEIKYNGQTPVNEALAAYRRVAELELVEPCKPYQLVEPIKNSSEKIMPSAFSGATNDPLFNQQWHFKNTGQTNGTSGADISLPEAWTVQTGSPEVIVAVIDGGIDILHPDLQASMWINADEIAGNGIDDDHNGYVDDVNGYGFGDNTGRIYPNFHGTHVGGTIAAVTNNGVGVAGIAGGDGPGNGVRLMSCAGFGSVATGGFEDAMVYAADNGAVISQNSWRGGSHAIEAAIDYFVARAGYDNSESNFDNNIQIGPMAGGIVIFAAGNSNTSDPNDGYPASYSPNMAVAATDHNDIRSVFSNYGSWVDIAAPGTDVFSTYPVELGSYTTLSGTSMACPHVSGVAALIISQFKGPGYSPFLVWDRIQFTADDIDVLNPGYIDGLGSGRINAFQALQVDDDIPPSPITTLSASLPKLSSMVLQWTATGASGNTGVASSYDLRYSLTPITEANFNSATPVTGVPKPKIAGSPEEFEVVGLTQGTTYYFAIKSRDFFGNIASLSNVISASTLEPPIIQVTPLFINSAMLSGQSETRNISIQNTGASTLSWSLIFSSTATPESLNEGMNKETVTEGKDKNGFNNSNERVSNLLAESYSPEAIGDFERRAPSPVPLTCVTVDASTGSIYAQANMGTSFYRYLPATNQWIQLASSPIPSGNNGGAIFLNGKIYTSYLQNNSIGVYNLATNSWSTIASGLPGGGTGSMATDGTYLYFAKGTELRRYAPSANSWVSLASCPFYFTGWGGLVFYNNTLIGHQGDNNVGFAKYNISTNTWSLLPNTPGGTVLGAAVDLSAGIYYAHGSYGGNYWYSFDINDGTWTVITETVFPSLHDGGMAYVSQNGVSGIYFTEGEERTGFARFETAPSSSWLSVSQFSGDVVPGTSHAVVATLDAENLYGGTYYATIEIRHNDPVHAAIEIPVTLVVTGEPAIEVNKTSMAFGNVYVGAIRDSVITITNTGTDVLSVSAITVGNTNYQIAFEPFSLNPTEYKEFSLVFRPSSPGTFNSSLTIVSNDASHPTTTIPLTGVGLFNPLSVTPSSIALTLNTGQLGTRQMTIANNGSSSLIWNGVTKGIGDNSIDITLENLNANYMQVTAAIPNRYDFYEGISGNNIGDGGNDMYDNGNYLATDIGGESSYIDYSDGVIRADSRFGTSGKYFTTKYSGLFVLTADISINSFSILGNLGADGGGAVDGTVLTASRSGKSYKGFIKRVYNAGDPSVNHLIIVEDNGIALQTYSSDTNNDYHKLSNLSGVNRIYYLLFAGSSGLYIDNATMQNIMEVFLNSVNEGIPWITLGKKTGTLPSAGSENISVNFNAAGMDGGIYNASIIVNDNVPLKESVTVPVTLTVIGVPDIDLSKTSVNFQNVYLGDSVTRFLSLKNLGSDKLIVSSMISSNDRFTITPSGVTLLPRDSIRINIKFKPSVAGLQSGTLQILSNDSDEAIRTITLSGNGTIPPVANLTPESIDMKIFKGDRQNVMIRIRNTGGDVMNWSISNGWLLPNWSSLSAQSGNVRAGDEQSLKLTVDANTLSLTKYTFEIYFNYNSPIRPQIVIPVTVQVVQNRPPVIIRAIENQSVQIASPAVSINLAENFVDADGEPLLYYVNASNTVVRAYTLGSSLMLEPLQLGESEINVWAVDGLGERADLYFTTSVHPPLNHSPFVIRAIDDQTIQQQDPALSINLAEYFADEDDEPLSYGAAANDAIVNASFVGSLLLLEARDLGTSRVEVWTVDGSGERADLHFNITVEAVTAAERDALISSLQNHPNPFDEMTTISYQLKKNGHVQLVLQDVTGRVIETLVDENQLPGAKSIEYKGTTIQSGLYFYHLIVDGKSCGIRKMIKY